MYALLNIFNLIFNLFFKPFKNLPPLWPLIVISVVTGILMLLIFRSVSNQSAIKKAKDKIKAHIFELVLYRDNLKIITTALLKILKYNLVYLKQTIFPLLVIFLPVIVILIQINFRYQYRPLKDGETALVKLKWQTKAGKLPESLSLTSTEKISVETPPLRIPELNEVDWRIKIIKPGAEQLSFDVNGQTVSKSVATSTEMQMISPTKTNNSFFRLFFNPAEKPVPGAIGIESIEVTYPEQELKIFGWKTHWLVVFFIVSLIAAFGLKGVFGVEL